MALTMTRTRTQTALTRLAGLLATLSGELDFVEWLLGAMPEHRDLLSLRRDSLMANRDAVAATLRQFDPQLAVDTVGRAHVKRSRRAMLAYLAGLQAGAGNRGSRRCVIQNYPPSV
jgi:hypothetical protein